VQALGTAATATAPPVHRDEYRQASQAESRDRPRRAGFTDFSGSSATTPPVTSQERDEPPSRAPAVRVLTADTSWNDVAKASDFYDAARKIAAKCARDWPGDDRMARHCVDDQTKALNALKQGRPFGTDENRWNSARVRCAREWPDDYHMRLYCEQH
jgi:hypothetical protein